MEKLKFALSDPDPSKRMEAFKTLGQAFGQLPKVLGRLEAVKGELSDVDKLSGAIADERYALMMQYKTTPETPSSPPQSTRQGGGQPSGRKGGAKRQEQPTPSGGGSYEQMRKEVEEGMKWVSNEIRQRQKRVDNFRWVKERAGWR